MGDIRSLLHCDDPELDGVIEGTLARLPEDVRTFVTEQCEFLCLDEQTEGMAFRKDEVAGEWLIVIRKGRLPRADLPSLVAHEVAHAFLGHCASECEAQNYRHEIEVVQLVRAWGFDGYGAVLPADRDDYLERLSGTPRDSRRDTDS